MGRYAEVMLLMGREYLIEVNVVVLRERGKRQEAKLGTGLTYEVYESAKKSIYVKRVTSENRPRGRIAQGRDDGREALKPLLRGWSIIRIQVEPRTYRDHRNAEPADSCGAAVQRGPSFQRDHRLED